MSRRFPCLLSLVGVLLGGCDQSMDDQAKYEAFEAADLFPDGKVSQPPVPGTIARGELAWRAALTERPPLDRPLIERGRDGQRRPCRLVASPLTEAADWIDEYRVYWEQAFDRLEQHLAAPTEEHE